MHAWLWMCSLFVVYLLHWTLWKGYFWSVVISPCISRLCGCVVICFQVFLVLVSHRWVTNIHFVCWLKYCNLMCSTVASTTDPTDHIWSLCTGHTPTWAYWYFYTVLQVQTDCCLIKRWIESWPAGFNAWAVKINNCKQSLCGFDCLFSTSAAAAVAESSTDTPFGVTNQQLTAGRDRQVELGEAPVMLAPYNNIEHALCAKNKRKYKFQASPAACEVLKLTASTYFEFNWIWYGGRSGSRYPLNSAIPRVGVCSWVQTAMLSVTGALAPDSRSYSCLQVSSCNNFRSA